MDFAMVISKGNFRGHTKSISSLTTIEGVLETYEVEQKQREPFSGSHSLL